MAGSAGDIAWAKTLLRNRLASVEPNVKGVLGNTSQKRRVAELMRPGQLRTDQGLFSHGTSLHPAA